MIIISFKNISCFAVLFSYIIKGVYYAICNKISIFIILENLFCFPGDPLVSGILGRPERSSHQRRSMKKVFLEISQNSQENTCARVSFLLKKRPWHRCFLVNFAKFARTPFLQNTSGRLLLT